MSNDDVSVNAAAIEKNDLCFQCFVQVRTGEHLGGQLSANDTLELRLPVILEPNDVRYVMSFAVADELQARVAQIDEESFSPESLIDLEMNAVMLSGRTQLISNHAASSQ